MNRDRSESTERAQSAFPHSLSLHAASRSSCSRPNQPLKPRVPLHSDAVRALPHSLPLPQLHKVRLNSFFHAVNAFGTSRPSAFSSSRQPSVFSPKLLIQFVDSRFPKISRRPSCCLSSRSSRFRSRFPARCCMSEAQDC